MKQPKSFEEGLTRLQELLTALQDESAPCWRWPPVN